MNNFFIILGLVNQLLPLILQTVKALEVEFPQGGQGAQKLQMVTSIIEQALSATQGLQVTAQQLLPIVTPIVSAAVAMYKANGTFKTSVQTPAQG